jgi:sec-independent protein translocase protein TatB
MFDIGWPELFLIAVVALIVIGPKDMPRAMRTLAKGLGKLRALSREFQSGVADMMREAELDEIRRKVDEAGRMDVKEHVSRMVDPDGRLRDDLDLADAFRPDADDPDRAGRPPAATAPYSAYGKAPAGSTPTAQPAAPSAETPAAAAASPHLPPDRTKA